jgi:putative flippase GtrA
MMKKELTKYIIVGISAVATDFVTYRLLLLVVTLSVAKTLSYILGMIVAFKSERNVQKDMVKFVSVYMLSLFLNVSINHSILYLFPFAITFAFIIATGVSVITNYIGQKYWVFKK